MQYAISPNESEAYQLDCIFKMKFRILNVTLPITNICAKSRTKLSFIKMIEILKVQSKSQRFLQSLWLFLLFVDMFYGEVIVQRGDLKNKILISM